MKSITEQWNNVREALDFEMYLFRKAHELKTLNFPHYYDVIYDAFVTEFGGINHEEFSQNQMTIDGMIEALSAKYLADSSKEHLAKAMRVKLEREMGM